MQLFQYLVGTLVLASQATTLAIPINMTKLEIEAKYTNTSIVGPEEKDDLEDLLSGYFFSRTFESSSINSTSLNAREERCTLGGVGKVPLWELPCCYQACITENCCNMMPGGPGDVR